ncbi:TPA: hypothetical protein SIA31_004204 [Aeromonas sobria]|nr:hypothetical protein [Aeromonas sobria]
MQSINIHRGKAIVISSLLMLFLWGGWWFVSKQAYDTYQAIINGVNLVKISVYGLWMPLGFLGVGLVVAGGAFVSCVTGVKANFVWGELGKKVINYVVGIFAFLGLITAIFSYQWMTNKLEEQGYLYCKPLSRISAMGRYEVYVATPELCVKPNKIP